RITRNWLQYSSYLDIKPFEGWSFRSMIGGGLILGDERKYNYQFFDDETTFLTAGGNQRSVRSSLFVKNENAFRWVWDNFITYEKTLGKNYFKILGGTTAEAYHLQWASAKREEVPADKDLWYITTGNANTSTNDGNGDKWTRNSYISRINDSFDDTYLLTATLRADGSSRISKDKRWGMFPSVGLGWVLSNESFLSSYKFIETLKFRIS